MGGNEGCVQQTCWGELRACSRCTAGGGDEMRACEHSKFICFVRMRAVCTAGYGCQRARG